ncbi:MAG: hypothetical protein ABSE06_01055 [Anaerolineaceae bacterium]
MYRWTKKVAERFGDRRGYPDLLFVAADIISRASIEAGLHQVVEHWGAPHALITLPGWIRRLTHLPQEMSRLRSTRRVLSTG